MKLYGLVYENPDGYLFVANWFFSPEDREKHIRERNEKMSWRAPMVYEKEYWFTELNTDEVSYIAGDHGVKELEEAREAKWLTEEEEEQ